MLWRLHSEFCVLLVTTTIGAYGIGLDRSRRVDQARLGSRDNDRRRQHLGRAPSPRRRLEPTVAVPGWVRLIIEAAYFTGVVTALTAAGQPELGIAVRPWSASTTP